MTGWSSSDRRSRLPADWQRRRRSVRRRANDMCEAPGCGNVGTECDHIVPGDDHSLENLQWLCEACHKRKTAAESLRARGGSRTSRRRAGEIHPGRLA